MSWLERLVEVSEQPWRRVGTPAFVASSLLVAGVALVQQSRRRLTL